MDKRIVGTVIALTGGGILVWKLWEIGRTVKAKTPARQPELTTSPKQTTLPQPSKPHRETGRSEEGTSPSQPPPVVLKIDKTSVNEGEWVNAYVTINNNLDIPRNESPAMALESGGRAVIPPFNAPLRNLPMHLRFRVHAGPIIEKYIDVPAVFGLCPGNNDVCFSIRGSKVYRSNIVKVFVRRRSSLVVRSFKADISKVDDRRADLHIDMDISPQPIDMPVIIRWYVPSTLVGQEWALVSTHFLTVPKGRSNISVDVVASVRDPAYPNRYYNPLRFHRHKVVVWKPCDWSSRVEKIIHI